MEVGAVGGSTAGVGTSTAASSTGFDKELFLKLFVAQLKGQNPFDAMDTSDFGNQMAQFSSLEALQNMRESVDVMRAEQGLALASGLIGSQVEYMDDDGELVTGLVELVTQAEGSIFLQVNGFPVGLAEIRTVKLVGS